MIRECRATSRNVLALTSKGEASLAAHDAFATAMIGAARVPKPVRYVLRLSDDKRTFR